MSTIISKATIADALGISVDNIPDSVYSWGKKQFFAITNLQESAVSKTYRKFISSTTSWLKLPHRNITAVTGLVVGTSTVAVVMGTNVIINEDSGLMTYTGGFGGGQKVVVTYTVGAYTHKEIYDLLITLFVLKGLVMFTPQEVYALVQKITIGKYSKTFAAVESSLGGYLSVLDTEIEGAKKLALDDDGQMGMGTIA